MILDSGERTVFESGAVRDVQSSEKGRCDLLPFDVIADLVTNPRCCQYGAIFKCVSAFQSTGDSEFLEQALKCFCEERKWNIPTMLLEVSIHFSEGAAKYSERNWEKGIPLQRYVDSAVRHYLKWVRGDTDERHDRAFCWNIICAIWTCKHHPHLNEYGKDGEE